MNEQVRFDEPGMDYAQPALGAERSFLSNLIIRTGLAKDAKQAQVVLIIIGALSFAVMLFVWYGNSSVGTVPPPEPELKLRGNSGGSPNVPVDDSFDF